MKNPITGWFRHKPRRVRGKAAPPRLLTYRVANLQGLGTRERQEDSFAFANAMDVTEIRRRGMLAVVADGMGGMEDGKRVSEAAVASLLACFNDMDRQGDLPGQLRRGIEDTAAKLYGEFQGVGGTTLVACLFYQEALYWASVGDSYLYLRRGGRLYRMNREHNYRTELYQEAVRQGRLDPSEANADPNGHRLSQFLGKDEVEEIDLSLRPLPLQDGDAVLLCSDGVGGVLDEAALLECLSAVDPSQACASMDQRIRALCRRSQDNYTALVVACGY